MSSPEEHPILDRIYDAIGKDNEPEFSRLSLESECIEFWDSEEGQWYEIVVRAIDEPSRYDELEGSEDDT